jgi:hypothetical protein
MIAFFVIPVVSDRHEVGQLHAEPNVEVFREPSKKVAAHKDVHDTSDEGPTADEQLDKYRRRMKDGVERLGKQWNATATVTLREKISFIAGVMRYLSSCSSAVGIRLFHSPTTRSFALIEVDLSFSRCLLTLSFCALTHPSRTMMTGRHFRLSTN